MASLALNMIVRSEAAIIERCLRAAIPHICAAVVVDTGSTDDTIAIMMRLFAESGIPYEIHTRPFINFMQARNAALDCARNSALSFDYLMLADADMELVVEDPNCFANLNGPSYDIIQKAGALSYHNRRIVNRSATGGYLGVTHEYLDVAGAGCLSGVFFLDHACGSNRSDKFPRDIALLIDDLRSDPDNGRSWFYLAQSYRDNGQPAQAAQAYSRRVELGGWPEETFDARMNYAHALRNQGDEGGFILGLLDAYNDRPTRGEPLYDLAKFFRERGDNYASLLFSKVGMKLPMPTDMLFVNEFVHKTGLREEFSICAFYDPPQRALGFKVANSIALDPEAPQGSRDLAKHNLYFYLEPLLKFAPSFKAHRIDYKPRDGYIAMNPSIVNHNDRLLVLVRTVNYTITEDGRYEIRAGDGSITNDNPIDTENWICGLANDLNVMSAFSVTWNRPEAAFKPVIGLEDMRLISNGRLHFSACVREQNVEGWCEQWTGQLRGSAGADVGWFVDNERAMLPKTRQNEKNWMPFVRDQDINFVYRLGTVVDEQGCVVDHRPPTDAVDTISGSSQVIPFAGAFLAVVHESRFLPGTCKRYYQHRFALMDANGALHKLSLPFVFHDKQIEFCAGLCWHPDHQRLLISYGVRDEEAWIAEVDWQEIMEMFV